MKELGSIRLALVFAGCFLGAGYVSGQELLQFFGSFGVLGYVGLFVTMLLLFFLGVLILRLSQLTGFSEADRIIVPWDSPFIRAAVSVLECTMLFGIVAIMAAGIGALAEQLFALPYTLCCFVFCVLILLSALAGLKSIVSAFSFSVPLLVAATLVFGVIAISRGASGQLSPIAVTDKNALLGNWLLSSLNFACYNIFGTIAILAAFGPLVKKRCTVYTGLGLGTLALLLIALSVLICLSVWPDSAAQELPMLYAAGTLGAAPGYVYAFLLFLAMFGTSLSCFVGFTNFLMEKTAFFVRHRTALYCVLAFAVFSASLFGFGDLISLLYPIFGYASAIFIVFMLINYFRQRSSKKVSFASHGKDE